MLGEWADLSIYIISIFGLTMFRPAVLYILIILELLSIGGL